MDDEDCTSWMVCDEPRHERMFEEIAKDVDVRPLCFCVGLDFQVVSRKQPDLASGDMALEIVTAQNFAMTRIIRSLKYAGLPTNEMYHLASAAFGRCPAFWQFYHQSKPSPALTANKWLFAGLEVFSRAHAFNDAAGIEEITKVIGLLRKNFVLCLFQYDLRIQLSASPLSLGEQKRLVVLTWVAEDILFSMCSPSRRSNGVCMPITRYSQLAIDCRYPPSIPERQTKTLAKIRQEMQEKVPIDLLGDQDTRVMLLL